MDYNIDNIENEPDTTQTCWDSFKYHISKWAARLPLINFLYFAFFDDATGPPPTREDVSALANLIALVTALLFTIATAVPMSVGRGDLEHWDWQYSATGPYGCFGFNMYKYGAYTVDGIDVKLDISQEPDYTVGILASAEGEMEPSTKLAHVAQDSIVWLAGSTLYSVVVLISLATLPPAEEPDHKLQYWWAIIKYLLLLATALAVLGTFKTMQTVQYLFWMQFPDSHELQTCNTAGWQLQGWRGQDENGHGFYGFESQSQSPSCEDASDFRTDEACDPRLAGPGRFPVTEGWKDGIEFRYQKMTLLWTLGVMLLVIIISGYAAFFYEEEHICSIKLNAGDDFDPHADEDKAARLKRLFAKLAAAGIDRDSMARLDNDVLLETILEKAGIAAAGDRLSLILAIRDSDSETCETEFPRTVQPTMNSSGTVNPQQQLQGLPLLPVLPALPALPQKPIATATVKAVHAFSPTAPNQIAMMQGEIFTLVDGVGNWWKVKSASGTEGLVPSNYVEKIVATAGSSNA